MKLQNSSWKVKEQEEFLLRIGDLYLNGYSLLEAIELMGIHYEDMKKNDLARAIREMKDGYSIHKVLETLRFHQDALSLIYFSRKHGNLGQAFKHAGQLMGRKRHYRNRLWSILQYPSFLICLVLLMLLFVQTVLLPQFELLFEQMNIVQNEGILLFVAIASKIPHFLFFNIVTFLLLYVLYKKYEKQIHPSIKLAVLMKIPFVRIFLSLHYSHYFCQQLSSLLASGLNIKESIAVFEQQIYQPYLQIKAKSFREKLIEGEKLEQLIEKENLFDKGLSLVIMHGQKNGRLAQELQDYSDLLLSNFQKRIESLLGKIQPCLFLTVGAFVFMLYLCIFIPMFQLLGGI